MSASKEKHIVIKIANATDVDGILHLQERNLSSVISQNDRPNGFVTTKFSHAQLDALLDQKGIFVAKHDDQLVGYALAGSWDYFSQWSIYPYMTARFSSFTSRPIDFQHSFQYGPICIDAAYRGSGMLRQLFEAMRLAFSDRYSTGITFINRINQRSYVAHTKKLGLTVIDHFEFNDQSYYCLTFDTKMSVLGSP